MKRSRKMLALFLCLAVLFSLLPLPALAYGEVDYGREYDHIDVKVDSEYTFTVDGVPTTVNGIIQPDTMVVKTGSRTYDFSKYNVRTQTEGGQTEYEIRASLSPDSIEWVEGTYQMRNVTVSGRMLFLDIPASLKGLLPTTSYNGKTYYYADFTDYKYTGLQECTGGRGMRSRGNSGTPTGLDLYIAADGLDILLTEGKIAIEKVIVDESGRELTDSASFSYTLTDAEGNALYFADGAYTADPSAAGASSTVIVKGGETVVLEGVPAGTYRITETQKAGYTIRAISGNKTTEYTTDYVVKTKQDGDIPVAVFTNTKLPEKGAVRLQKTASGIGNGEYPDPQVHIYAADSEGNKTGDALWSGTLPANGDAVYPNCYLPQGRYVIEESGAEAEGYSYTASLQQDGGKTRDEALLFSVSAGTVTSLTLSNTYSEAGTEPEDPADPAWDVSRSKTATNLDENYESKVTLSLPSAEEHLVTDVVFVLDESSCSEPVKAEVAKMLETLYAQVKNTGATIQIGAVQFRGEVTTLPLTELSETTKDTVADFMSARPATGGSNMSAGLLAGEAMLDADTSVSADRKYLILVSDGITYIWDDETTAEQENYGVNFANADAPSTPMLASPDGWDVLHGNGYVPSDWASALAGTESLLDKTIAEKATPYVRGEDISQKSFVAYGEKDLYTSTVDIALYASHQAYQRIASKYPHTYAVTAGVESEMAVYPFGPSFMKYLAKGAEVSFDGILNEIIYLVDAGSYVEDTIGYAPGDYNFDFISQASAMTLRVGNDSYAAQEIGENQFGFKPLSNGSYAYKVTYIPGNLEDTERFIWEINEAVTNFAPVSLTYTVKLTNPKTTPGTYGTYDTDGSAGHDGLYTNISAILFPVDTNGNPGPQQVFSKPTVSYTVKDSPAASTDPPEPSPSAPENPPASADPNPPKTGDPGNIGLWLALLLVMAGGAGTAVFFLKKHKE